MVAEPQTRFGELVDALLERYSLSYGQAAVRSEGRINRSYWGHMRSGQIPSRKVLDIIAEMFPDEDLTSLYIAAGYAPPSMVSDNLAADHSATNLPTPPGARLIADGSKPLPLGPPVSAHDQSGIGDTEFTDTFDLNAYARDRGADYLLEVAGECLEPHIGRGDWVAVKKTRTAQNGQVVVAHVMADGFRGELGDALTLKIYRTDGPEGRGFYRADLTCAHHASEARIVGKVVGHTRKKLPSFK